MSKEWSRPHEVTDLDIAFPADALKYMPSMEECEAGLNALDPDERQKWIDFQSTWFYKGLPATFQVWCKTLDGEVIDGNKAFRHLKVIQGSFASHHEHKRAAVAYLASLWFRDLSYEGFDLPSHEVPQVPWVCDTCGTHYAAGEDPNKTGPCPDTDRSCAPA